MNPAQRIRYIVDHAHADLNGALKLWHVFVIGNNDLELHKTVNRDKAAVAFSVIQDSLLRDLAISLARLWDTNKRTSASLRGAANFLSNAEPYLIQEIRATALDSPPPRFIEDSTRFGLSEDQIQASLKRMKSKALERAEIYFRQAVYTSARMLKVADHDKRFTDSLRRLKDVRDSGLAHREVVALRGSVSERLPLRIADTIRVLALSRRTLRYLRAATHGASVSRLPEIETRSFYQAAAIDLWCRVKAGTSS